MKFDNLTSKNKNSLLLAVFLLLLVLTYYLSIEPTTAMMKEVNKLKGEMIKAEDAPVKIARMKEQMAEWDQNIVESGDGRELHLLIFDEVSKVSKNIGVQVLENRCLNSRVDKDITIDTYETTLAGNFKSLVRTLFQIENNMKYGFVSSASFDLVKNKRGGSDDLVLRIVIQTMINN